MDLDEEVIEKFLQYSWPGNIRELENLIEATVHLTNKERIGLKDLPDHFSFDDGKRNIAAR